MTESKIEATCKVKDGKAGWVDGKEEVLDQKKIDTTYKEECLTCDDLLEKNKDKFKWMCKIEVQSLSRIVFLQFIIFRERNLRSR